MVANAGSESPILDIEESDHESILADSKSVTPPPITVQNDQFHKRVRLPASKLPMIERWVVTHDNNLYPTREEKEDLAKEIGVQYNQINRWFANRRRKAHSSGLIIKRAYVGSLPGPSGKSPKLDQCTDASSITDTKALSSVSGLLSLMENRNPPTSLPINAYANPTTTNNSVAATPPALQAPMLNPLFVHLLQQNHTPSATEQINSQYLTLLIQQMQTNQALNIAAQQAQVTPTPSPLCTASTSVQVTIPSAQPLTMNIKNENTRPPNTYMPQWSEIDATEKQMRQTCLDLANLTEAEKMAICALSDMCRAPA